MSGVEQTLELVQQHKLSIAEVRVPCYWTVDVSNEFRELVDDLAGDEEATETMWEWACENERELGAPLVQALGELGGLEAEGRVGTEEEGGEGEREGRSEEEREAVEGQEEGGSEGAGKSEG